MTAPTVTQVCNHKTYGPRYVFCTGTKHKSEIYFFVLSMNYRSDWCAIHLLSWKHTSRLETLIYQNFLTIYENFNNTKHETIW